MKIKALYLKRFGGVKEKKLFFEEGFNLLSFKNEFGKTSAIEAIKCAFYGFSPLKQYPYLPLTADALDFDCEIDCSEESSELGKLKIRRVHTGERVSGILTVPDSKGERSIRNKSLFSALKEAGLSGATELVSEFWMIDADSIEERRIFLQKTEAGSLSLLDGIGYRGRSEAELIEELERKQKKIFTNHANSVSKIKKNEAELAEIRRLIRELAHAEEEAGEEYRESLILAEQSQCLEEKRERLKEEKRRLEREREAEQLRSALRASQREYVERGYAKLEQMPHLEGYRDLIERENRAIREREELEASLRVELDRAYDPVVRELILLKKDETIARLFALHRNLKERSARLDERKAGIERMATAAETLSIERCRNEFQNYQLLYAKWKERSGEFRFGKKSVFLSLLLLAASAIAFLFHQMSGFALLFLSGLFLVLQYLGQERLALKREGAISAFSPAAFSELGKLYRASKLIHHLREPSEEASDLILGELEEIAAYQNLLAECRVLREDFERLLEGEAELRRIFLLEGRDLDGLFLRYRREEYACKMREEQVEGLRFRLQRAKETEERLSLKRIRLSSLLLELWGSDDLQRLGEIRSEAEAHRRRHKDLEAMAEEKKISLDNLPGEGYNFHKELEGLEANLEETELRLAEKKERLARLEERLSSPLRLSSPAYQGMTLEDLQDLSSAIREQNRSLHLEYNVLEWKIRIVRRSFELLKQRLKPNFVERADLYFSEIAPDAKCRIDYGVEGSIVFQDRESAEYLDYSRLSTGAQAQVLLALKLSYLEELDPDRRYPLILDDALMSYDSERRESALALLRELAKERQILYFAAD